MVSVRVTLEAATFNSEGDICASPKIGNGKCLCGCSIGASWCQNACTFEPFVEAASPLRNKDGCLCYPAVKVN